MLKFLIITVLPVAFLLLYLYRQDKEKPEPKQKLAACFGLGMLGGAAGRFVKGIFSWLGIGSGYESVLYGDIICEAVVSAVFVSIVYLILWKHSEKNPDFDEFFDGPVYSVCIAFGYQFLCSLLTVFSDEWYYLGLLSIMTIVAIYAAGMVIGYYYSMARFGDMPLTRNNRIKMWAIPWAIVWTYNCFCDWSNQSAIGTTIAIVVFAILGYYIYKKNNAIIDALKRKDITRPDSPSSDSSTPPDNWQ